MTLLAQYSKQIDSIPEKKTRLLLMRVVLTLQPKGTHIDLQKANPALKRVFKIAKQLAAMDDTQELAEKNALLNALVLKIEAQEFDAVITDFDKQLSSSDWEKAKFYFAVNPDKVFCGSKQGMMYSYINSDKKIIRREGEIGVGSFGRIKVSRHNSEENPSGALKRQKIIFYKTLNEFQNKELADIIIKQRLQALRSLPDDINSAAIIKRETEQIMAFTNPIFNYKAILAEYHFLPLLQKEAAINKDLGIGISDLLVRRDAQGIIYKVYQDMLYLGLSWSKIVQKNQPNSDERFMYAIDLLLKVDALHSGIASKSGTIYAHRDIKPANLLVDEQGEMHLIDFGLTKDKDLLQSHKVGEGTNIYKPISFDLAKPKEALDNFPTTATEISPTYFFDDKIAALRTIYHQLGITSILTEEDFKTLPPYLSALLDTSNIGKCIVDDSKHTIKYIASVLILYRYNRSLSSEKAVGALVNNEKEQQVLINKYPAYRQNAAWLKGASKKMVMERLLAKTISYDELPFIFSTDPEVVVTIDNPQIWLAILADAQKAPVHEKAIECLLSLGTQGNSRLGRQIFNASNSIPFHTITPKFKDSSCRGDKIVLRSLPIKTKEDMRSAIGVIRLKIQDPKIQYQLLYNKYQILFNKILLNDKQSYTIKSTIDFFKSNQQTRHLTSAQLMHLGYLKALFLDAVKILIRKNKGDKNLIGYIGEKIRDKNHLINFNQTQYGFFIREVTSSREDLQRVLKKGLEEISEEVHEDEHKLIHSKLLGTSR